MNALASRVVLYGRMVKFSHSVFALPFALASAALAAGRRPPVAPGALDRRGDGGRAQRGHGLQPAGRPRDRRAQPAHGGARAAAGRVAARRGVGVRDPVRRRARRRGRHAQPAVPGAVSGRARDRVRLLVHEALHGAVPRLSRPGAGHRPGRRLARDPRRARGGADRARAGRALLGGRASTRSTPARTSRSTGRRACIRCPRAWASRAR